MRLEIMDTTLRDGEQTSGVAFTAPEKLHIAKSLLEEVKVDRIEVASARISDGERDAVRGIVKWASNNDYLDCIEVLRFIDGGKSINWIAETGAKVINLLSKGSLNHLEKQLKKEKKTEYNQRKFGSKLRKKFMKNDQNITIEIF